MSTGICYKLTTKNMRSKYGNVQWEIGEEQSVIWSRRSSTDLAHAIETIWGKAPLPKGDGRPRSPAKRGRV